MRRERAGRTLEIQEREQSGQVRKVSDEHQIARFVAQAIPHDHRRIRRLEIAGRRERAERVAGAPEYLRRLAAAQLSAVPHDIGASAARRGVGRKPFDSGAAASRERPARIDLRSQGVAVMNQVEKHLSAGVRVLALLLIVWEPIAFAAAASRAFNAIAVRGLPVVLVLVARLVATALCVAAGRALLDARPPGVTLSTIGLALSGTVQVFALLTPYFPSNRLPGETPLYLTATLAYYGGWLLYVLRSRRVAELRVR